MVPSHMTERRDAARIYLEALCNPMHIEQIDYCLFASGEDGNMREPGSGHGKGFRPSVKAVAQTATSKNNTKFRAIAHSGTCMLVLRGAANFPNHRYGLASQRLHDLPTARRLEMGR